MLSSIELGPPGPYLPKVFINNQFFTETKWPPKDTDLTDKVAIVTGANSGLGLECSRQLLGLQLRHLIIAVRSTSKGEDAATILRCDFPQATVSVWELDMGSYESVQAFVKKVDAELTRLDIAILNAGQYNLKFNINPKTGHEETVQVNYLSTVLLAVLLCPILKHKSPAGVPGRLTIVSAALAYTSKFEGFNVDSVLHELDDPSKFDGRDRYPTSKLLMHLFMYKIGEYIDAKDVVVNLVCPGLVRGTGLQQDWPKPLLWIAKSVTFLPARTVDVGASTYIDAAVVQGEESHACFLMSWKIAPFVALLYTPEGKQLAEKLWIETFRELEFASAKQILLSMKRA